MNHLTRRDLFRNMGATTALLLTPQLDLFAGKVGANDAKSDSLPMQLYRSMSEEQKHKVCLAIDHPRRQFVSNWWYIHPEYRIPSTFTREQQDLIQTIFNSLHSTDYQEAIKKQVTIDQYGDVKNAPAVGFFGTPEDDDFEFLFTGHHVTRRCNVHSNAGTGFGGAPIFYGHYPHSAPNMRDNFNETKDHPGNPYWYQGLLFNDFVQSLDGKQQSQGLVTGGPRSESPESVVKNADEPTGLNCAELSADQKKLFLDTMKKMLVMFREGDVNATIDAIEKRGIVDRLHVSWFAGEYDIGSDRVWDTWQIEGPDMVWYYRGEPHIHCYLHLKG